MKNLTFSILFFCLCQLTVYSQTVNPVNFTITDTHGNDITLYEELAKGKVVILDFFATWCGPCIQSMPFLENLYNEYGGIDGCVLIIAMDADNSETAAMVDAFKAQHNVTYPAAIRQSARFSHYGGGGIPRFVLIAPDTTVRYNSSGWAPSVGQTLGDIIVQEGILPLPVADFSFEIMNNGVVAFDASASQNGLNFEWDFGLGGNPGSGVSTGTVYSPGTYTVTLKVWNNCTYDSMTKTITVESPSSINSLAAQTGSVSIFPHPVHGNSKIRLLLPKTDRVRLSVLDLSGRVISVLSDETLAQGEHLIGWPTGLASGVYFLEAKFANGVLTEKVFVD